MKLYFDIGANKGDYTEYLIGRNADKVVCVEANTYQAQNISRRFPNTIVTVINKAASAEKGPVDFYVCPECDVVSSCDEQWRTDSRFSQPDRNWVKTQVDTVSIDELIKTYGIPAHIKIDVEGYEYNVLRSMTKNYGTPIRFEWSEEKLPEMILSIEYLAALGYSLFGVMFGDDFHKVPDEFMDKDDMIEYLKQACVPSRKELWGMIFCLNETDSYVE